MQYLLGILIFIASLFLILLILVQRGRGGGLAGAFGGMGGQSAFGTKAGDVFTQITVVAAAIWILLSILAIKLLNQSQSYFGERGPASTMTEPLNPGSGPAGSATTLPAGTSAGPSGTLPASTVTPPPQAEKGPASQVLPSSESTSPASGSNK